MSLQDTPLNPVLDEITARTLGQKNRRSGLQKEVFGLMKPGLFYTLDSKVIMPEGVSRQQLSNALGNLYRAGKLKREADGKGSFRYSKPARAVAPKNSKSTTSVDEAIEALREVKHFKQRKEEILDLAARLIKKINEL